MFGGAISILFTGYSGLLWRRIKALEKSIESREEENKILDRENKTLTAMIVMAGENAEGIQDMRKELARLLKGER